jgi:hypothetical protein
MRLLHVLAPALLMLASLAAGPAAAQAAAPADGEVPPCGCSVAPANGGDGNARC